MVRPNVADKTHIIFSNVSNRTRAYWVLLLPTVFVGLTIALKNIALPMYSDNPFVDSLDRSWFDDMSPWIEGCAGLCCDGLGGFKSYPGFCCHVRTSQFLLLTVSFDIVSLRDCQKEEFPNFPRVQRLLEVWLTRGRSSDSNIAKMRIDYVSEQNMWRKHILLPCTLHETNLAFPSYRLGRESTWFTSQTLVYEVRGKHIPPVHQGDRSR